MILPLYKGIDQSLTFSLHHYILDFLLGQLQMYSALFFRSRIVVFWLFSWWDVRLNPRNHEAAFSGQFIHMCIYVCVFTSRTACKLTTAPSIAQGPRTMGRTTESTARVVQWSPGGLHPWVLLWPYGNSREIPRADEPWPYAFPVSRREFFKC